MKNIFFITIISAIFITSCKSKLPDSYHMDKKYWDTEDYDEALRYIKYSLPDGEALPRLSDPITAPVFIKLVDKENISTVLEDNTLGLTHRNDISKKYFDISQDILKIYSNLDKQDKFEYPEELVKALDLSLYTQLIYFKLGNDEIIKNAIDPNSAEIVSLTTGNENTLVSNFELNLERFTKEDAFNDNAKKEYANVLTTNYERLLQENKKADYSSLLSTIEKLESKSNSFEVKSAYNAIISKIKAFQLEKSNSIIDTK